MITVLIVEDDPMVAEFNKRYLDEVDGFSLSGIAHNVREAQEQLKNKVIDLVLLDVYMPGENGLTLLSYIREQEKEIDVILITAASEVKNIQHALRYGAIDYLIKPFEFDRFQKALHQYRDQYKVLSHSNKLKQEELDHLLSKVGTDQRDAGQPLPKGLTKSTLKIIVEVIQTHGQGSFSTEEISEQTEISRVSVRKYLKFLTEIEVLEETLTYGVGRPVYLYQFNDKRSAILASYL